MKSSSQMLSVMRSTIKRKLTDSLDNANIHIEDIPGIEEAFEDVDDFIKCLSKTWLMDHTVSLEELNIKKILLGKIKAPRKRNGKRSIVEIENSFYYVPLLQTLQLQLNSPELFDIILAGPIYSKDSEVLQDFCDGTFMNSHELFATDKCSIKILLYYDDVNVCNPLSNKNHKISAFYYQLANLPIKYRSKIKSINLLALCTWNNVKEYGIDKIFEPLVEELKQLGDDRGFPFQLYGGTVSLRGGLLAVLADTPASQCAGGFKEGVGGAYRKCRHCMANPEDMQNNFFEENFVLRNMTTHEKYLELIENAPSQYLRTYYSKKSGVTRRSKLLEADNFDVCEQLPQDLMHIFLEGILAYELKLMLNYYIHDGQLTLKGLNEKLEHFPLGYNDKKNKPSPILERDLEHSRSSNLGQSASEMWLLSRILPFILSDTVNTSSEHWHCFTSLLEIMSICFSSKISYSMILYLKQLIHGHLSDFKKIYNASITPKQHYMIHIPSLTLKFGPLVRSWCMRFESKHMYFKELARNIKNFKNLPYSLVSRHQAKQYAESIQINNKGKNPTGSLFHEDISSGKTKTIQNNNERQTIINNISRFYDMPSTAMPQDDDIFETSSVTIQNRLYKTGRNNFLMCSVTPTGLPEFGKIERIWYFNLDLFFALEVGETIRFDESLQAFEFEECNQAQGYHITMEKDLLHLNVLHTYSVGGKKYITLRESIFV
ncbi:uncharacterized protein LOC110247358 [Exaiptasia diaphana]|uniref:Uncharacterized protein n=1 Tax=Exaiptasia diaphana TaxID=2652724 RepID=A0A913XUN6_EXADI|nr:uncharacterized protein LOC110247358 [Exaiptasia diaphana]